MTVRAGFARRDITQPLGTPRALGCSLWSHAYNDNTLQYIPTAGAFADGEYEVDGGWRYIQAGPGERMAAEAVRLLSGLRA